MEGVVFLLSFVARLLAVISAVLGFMAESKRLTLNDIYYSEGNCVYPATPAFVLGICAVSLLAAAQIMVSLIGSCSSGSGHGAAAAAAASGSRRIWGNVSYALSWVAAVIAAALYVQGVVWNAAATRAPESRSLFFVKCAYLAGGVFTRAALLSLAATALGIFSSVTTLRAQQAPAGATTESSTTTSPPAAGGSSGPKKPDVPPPTGEAIAVPVQAAWNAPSSHPPPQRQAQPAYEVVVMTA